MRALVTGGNGFLGRHVVAALLTSGAAARVLDRVEGPAAPDAEQIRADLLSDDLVPALAGIDVVVHLAGSLHGPHDELVRNAVEGSRRLFEAMEASGTRRLVLASSFSVYDWSQLEDDLTEDAVLLDVRSAEASDGYAEGKSRQERLARDFAARHGWTLTVLRPAVLWGAGVWGEFLVGPRLGPLQAVVAPCAPIRLVYVENAADAFLRAARRSGGGELILNLIDPDPPTTWRYARSVTRQRGGLRVPVPYRAGLGLAWLVSALLGSSSKLPAFLRPRRFEALYKPVRCRSLRLERELGGRPLPFEAALARAQVQRD